jgi:hypothetical protein
VTCRSSPCVEVLPWAIPLCPRVVVKVRIVILVCRLVRPFASLRIPPIIPDIVARGRAPLPGIGIEAWRFLRQLRRLWESAQRPGESGAAVFGGKASCLRIRAPYRDIAAGDGD